MFWLSYLSQEVEDQGVASLVTTTEVELPQPIRRSEEINDGCFSTLLYSIKLVIANKLPPMPKHTVPTELGSS